MKFIVSLAVLCAIACTSEAYRGAQPTDPLFKTHIGQPRPPYPHPQVPHRSRRAGGSKPPASILSAEAKTNLHNREFHLDLELEWRKIFLENQKTKLEAAAGVTVQNGHVDPHVNIQFEHKLD